MKPAAAIVTVIVIIAYPFLVYWGIQNISLKIIGWIFLSIISIRFFVFKQGDKNWLPILLGVLLTTILLNLFNDPIYLKLNPVIISSCTLFAFSYTLFNPPSMIETFARLQDQNLPEKAIPYCKKITVIWCFFLLFNSLAALYTAIYSDMKTWTLYNGLISYILMGVLFAGEYIYRKLVLKPHES